VQRRAVDGAGLPSGVTDTRRAHGEHDKREATFFFGCSRRSTRATEANCASPSSSLGRAPSRPRRLHGSPARRTGEMPWGRALAPMTRWSAKACTGGEGAGHPAAAHARGGRGSSSRPSPPPPPTGAAAAARVATVSVVD